jgi:hypothetical protein
MPSACATGRNSGVKIYSADDDRPPILLLHVLDLLRVLKAGGDGLLHVQRHMGGEHLLHIVQALGRRGAEHHIIRLRDPGVEIVIADGLAPELRAIRFQSLPVHVKRGDDLPAELDDRASMGIGDIAGADHQNIHSHSSLCFVC